MRYLREFNTNGKVFLWRFEKDWEKGEIWEITHPYWSNSFVTTKRLIDAVNGKGLNLHEITEEEAFLEIL